MQKQTLKTTAKELDMSITQVNYKLKKIINKMVDRIMPEYDVNGDTIFDVVIALSEYLGVESSEIYNQLDSNYKTLCDHIAAQRAPYLAEQCFNDSGYESLFG